MIKYFFILSFVPVTLLGQVKTENPSFIPSSVNVKPLTDSNNFIIPEIQSAILEYLKSQKLYPQNYFVDSSIIKSDVHWQINIWDSIGLKNIKLFEKKRDSLEKVNRTTNRQQLKLPRPVGNPGNCFTVYYDIKKNSLISIEHWQ